MFPFWTDVSGTSIDLAGMRVDLGLSVKGATDLAQGCRTSQRDVHDARRGQGERPLQRRYERYLRAASEPEGEEPPDS